MAKAKTTETATAATAEGDVAAEAVPAARKRSKVKLFAIGGIALTLCLGGGGYFALPMALAMFAPTGGAEAHGAVAEAETEDSEASSAGGHGEGGSAEGTVAEGLPAERLQLPAHVAADYQIVSIYDGEAFLATTQAVIRVKVGSNAPGLGDILAIEASDTGGVVTGTLATLKTS